MTELLLLSLYWPTMYLVVSIVLGIVVAAIVATVNRKRRKRIRKTILAFLSPATAIAAGFISAFISGMAVAYFLHIDDTKQEIHTPLGNGYELRTSEESGKASIHLKGTKEVKIDDVDSLQVIGDTIIGKSKDQYFVLTTHEAKTEYYPSVTNWAYYTKGKMSLLMSPRDFYWQKREIAYYIAGVFCTLFTIFAVYLLWAIGLRAKGDLWRRSYPCPCCGNLTYKHKPEGKYEICPVCYWEDDLAAYEDPTSANNANGVSLEQAKLNYGKFGACRHDMINHVRQPRKNELAEK